MPHSVRLITFKTAKTPRRFVEDSPEAMVDPSNAFWVRTDRNLK